MKKLLVLVLSLVLLTACADLNFNHESLLTQEQLVDAIENPDNFDGSSIEVGVRVVEDLGSQDRGHYYEVELGPMYSYRRIILINKETQVLTPGDYVRVQGVINDTVNVKIHDVKRDILAIDTVSVEVGSYIETNVPAQKTLDINQSLTNEKTKITLNKLEVSDLDTRLYLSIENNNSSKIFVHPSSITLVIDEQEFKAEDQSQNEYEDFEDMIKPKKISSGIISYQRVELSEDQEIRVVIKSPETFDPRLNVESFEFIIQE